MFAQTVHLVNGSMVHLRHEIRVEASTSVESSRVVDNFVEILGSTDDSGTLKYELKNHAVLHVTGDAVMLETVLDGLSLTQVESTAISLIVSFLVLFALTVFDTCRHRLVPCGYCFALGGWLDGPYRSQVERLDRHGHGVDVGHRY